MKRRGKPLVALRRSSKAAASARQVKRNAPHNETVMEQA
jgi:hypothetical protein